MITWKPDFSGNSSDAAKADLYSDASVFLTTFTNMKELYMALSCAVFALDSADAVHAGNLASAIVTYSEDSEKKTINEAISIASVKPFVEDAAAVYEYAISICRKNNAMNMNAVPILLNYGNLCLDMNRNDKAKILFETALEINRDFLPAKQCMAAYWLSVGNREMAAKVLEEVTLPATVRKANTMDSDVKNDSTRVEVSDSISVIEEKIKKTEEMPLVLASDFYAELDPEGAKKARQFVDGLNSQLRYTAPDYHYLSQYTSLDNLIYGGGSSAIEVLRTELANYKQQHSITDNFYIPYKNSKLVPGISITADYANISLSKQEFMESPEAIVFEMYPRNYVNSTDLYTQNTTCLFLCASLQVMGTISTNSL